jgi:hypothetical protein
MIRVISQGEGGIFVTYHTTNRHNQPVSFFICVPWVGSLKVVLDTGTALIALDDFNTMLCIPRDIVDLIRALCSRIARGVPVTSAVASIQHEVDVWAAAQLQAEINGTID